MSHLKGISFESPEVQLQKLRERLCVMSDEELVKFGKMVRGLTEPRVSVMPDTWKEQLQEARAEWRRQPKAH
jgi:secreted protein with Ig-like and vWFA domain